VTEELEFEQRFARALSSVGLAALPKSDDPTEIVETVEPESAEHKTAAPIRAPTPINLFQHPDAHPIALDLALLRRYGPQWLIWEPETLEIRVPVDFKTQSLGALNLDKLMAVKTLHIVDGFWRNWEIFSACVQPLNGMFADFSVVQAPAYAEILVAFDTASKIRNDIQLSNEVQDYIRNVMLHDGVLRAVDPLEGIQPDVAGYPVDIHVIDGAWSAVRQTDRAPAGDSVEDEQLRRMLDAHRYLEQNRRRLRDQLPLVLQT
jgi:hypothetical protein